MTCPCEEDKCAGGLPAKVIEIVNECGPVLFHKVIRPASLGDDTVTPPEQLDYKNVLLTYEANNHSYLYSSDGVPTLISMGEVDTDALLKAINEVQTDLANEALTRAEADEKLAAKIQSNVLATQQNTTAIQANTNSIAEVKSDLGGIEANQSEMNQTLEQLDTNVTSLQNEDVVKDVAVSGNTSTVLLNKESGKLGAGATSSVDIPLPVASAETAGVMNPATFNAVQENAENIDSILGGAVLIEDLPATPTQDELTLQWKAATGKTTLINRASIFDKANGKIWYYYTNTGTWESADIQNPEINVSIATNDTPGIVKGSTEDGQVAVEADGSMSLNGYDGMQHDIENLSQLVAGIEVPKLPTSMVYDFVSPAGANNPSTADNANITARVVNTGTGAVTNATLMMPMASTTQAGSITAASKLKLDNLPAISGLGEGLELSEDGVLSTIGGGSDVNLLTAYTAEPTEGDVYDASYVNSKLQNNNIEIGKGAKSHYNATNLNRNSIAIGAGATATSSYRADIAIGINATAQPASSNLYGGITLALGYSANAGSGSIAIGDRASAYTVGNPSGMMAIGNSATAQFQYSVALGALALTSRASEVSIGNGGTVGTTATRYLANVRAGELPTDAVNLQQMQDYVAENAGNPFTEMETTRVQNLPPAVVTGFEDTTYGTDTITMHLDTKDLATGGASVQELMIEGATANTDTEGGHAGLMTAFQATQLAALAEGGAGGLTPDEVTKVQNLGTGSLTNMDGVLQTEEAVEIEFSRQNLVAGGSTTQTATIAAATTEEAGVMTPAMVTQLNSLATITAATAEEITAAWEAA